MRLAVLLAVLGSSPLLLAQCERDRSGVADALGTVFVDANDDVSGAQTCAGGGRGFNDPLEANARTRMPKIGYRPQRRAAALSGARACLVTTHASR